MSDKLPPKEEQERIQRQALTDITMICLQHEVKVEDLPKRTINLLIAIYTGGMAAGLKEAMKINNEPINPDDIKF